MPAPRRRIRLLPFLLVVCPLVAAPARADDAAFDERGGNVFFRQPDPDTAKRIDELIGRFAEDSVRARADARRELESIGYWAVEPLVTALQTREAPIRAASALTLGNMLDPRALAPLRDAVEKQTNMQFVAGFAAVAMARYADPQSVPQIRAALRSSKSLPTLRAAASLALARIRTPDAQALLVERLRADEGNVHVRSGRTLAMGFFPQLALENGGPAPSALLRDALRKGRREVRRAGIVAYIVATRARADTRDVLIEFADREDAPEALRAALVGLSRYEDSDTTRYLARRGARPGDEAERAFACDLLASRADAAALDDLLSIVRRPSAPRLRASAIVALGGIDHPDAAAAVLDRLDDRIALVRGAAVFASTRLPQAAAREEALRRIDARLRKGESTLAVRHDMNEARAVLSGQKSAADWREVGPERLFEVLSQTYAERLLAEVNLAAEDALDLLKIHNLQTDTEILAGTDDGGSGDGAGDGGDDGGDGGDGENTPPDDNPVPRDDGGTAEPPPAPNAPAVGSPRTNAWQEQRDLRIDLAVRPLFGPADLP